MSDGDARGRIMGVPENKAFEEEEIREKKGA